MSSSGGAFRPGRTVHVLPSLLSCDFSRVADEVRRAEAAGADLLHLDVMDGHFVPNLTIGPPVIRAIRTCTTLPLDCHLMIERPEASVAAYREAGADIVTVHAEASVHLERLLAAIRETGALAGLSFNPQTPVDVLPFLLHRVDLVLIMSVNPGFGGQAFLPSVLAKISATAAILARADHPVALEVDGGVDARTAPLVVSAGATHLVSGSYLFKAADMADAIDKLRVTPAAR